MMFWIKFFLIYIYVKIFLIIFIKYFQSIIDLINVINVSSNPGLLSIAFPFHSKFHLTLTFSMHNSPILV